MQTCVECSNAPQGACLCEGLPRPFCADCYWEHVNANLKFHITVDITTAGQLDSMQKVERFKKYSEKLGVLEDRLNQLQIYIAGYKEQINEGAESAIQAIRDISNSQVEEVDKVQAALDQILENVKSYCVVQNDSNLSQSLFDLISNYGAEAIDDVLVKRMFLNQSMSQNKGHLDYQCEFKSQEFFQVIDNPNLLTLDDVESIANSIDSDILEINIDTDIPSFHEIIEPQILYHVIEFTNRVYCIDISLEKKIKYFSEIPSITSFPRWPGCCLVDTNKIFICGGNNKEKRCLRDALVVDVDNLTSINLQPMLVKRNSPAVCVHKSKVYVFGGRKQNSRWIEQCEVFNPSTNQWTQLGEVSATKISINAIPYDNYIFLLGAGTNTALIFDPTTGKYELSNLPLKLSREQLIAGKFDNKIAILQGGFLITLNPNAQQYDQFELTTEYLFKSQLKIQKYENKLFTVVESDSGNPATQGLEIGQWQLLPVTTIQNT